MGFIRPLMSGPPAVLSAERAFASSPPKMSSVGEFAQLNFGCTVGREARIGAGGLINPGANVSGGVDVGDGVMIGTGAQILRYKKIGRNSIIGAVVVCDVPPDATVTGIPAAAARGSR